MKVEAVISRADIIRLNCLLLPRQRSTYLAILMIAFILFAVTAHSKGMPVNFGQWLTYVFVSICGGVGGIIGGFITSTLFILLSSKSTNGVLGTHYYEITPTGLLESTSANEGLSKWQGIQYIRVLNSYVVIQISGFLYHVVPKRSFASDEEFREFCDLAIEYKSRDA